jgi:hypothetical protein
MLDNTSANHVQVDVRETSCQMAVRLHGCRVVSIFPERAFASFASVEFLSRTASA